MIVFFAWLALAILTPFWLRKRFAFCQRLNDVHWGALVLLDIIVGFVVFNALWLVAALGDRPDGGETISAFAGRCALQEKRWALRAASAIDALFFVLTSQRDHCLGEAMKWRRA